MVKELKWLVGLGLAGAALVQFAQNTRVEVKVSMAPSTVLAARA